MSERLYMWLAVAILLGMCVQLNYKLAKAERKSVDDGLTPRVEAVEAEMRWRYRVLTEAVAETYGVEDRDFYAQALEEFARNRGRWEACLAHNIRFAMEFKDWKEKNYRLLNNREGKVRK